MKKQSRNILISSAILGSLIKGLYLLTHNVFNTIELESTGESFAKDGAIAACERLLYNSSRMTLLFLHKQQLQRA
jgi:hypothetical protein